MSAATAAARRTLMARGFTEHEAVALLLPIIEETYREVADDADEGADGDIWGTTVGEALHAFAAAYRKLADELAPVVQPSPKETPMAEARWTAPQDGYYRVGLGHDPVFLGTERPEDVESGELLRIEVSEHEVRGYQNSGGNLTVLDQTIPNGTWVTIPFDSDPAPDAAQPGGRVTPGVQRITSDTWTRVQIHRHPDA